MDALCKACAKGDLARVMEWLDAGVEVNTTEINGSAPMYYAVSMAISRSSSYYSTAAPT